MIGAGAMQSGGTVAHEASARPGYNPTGVPTNTGPFDVLVIGASFGGPKAVETILTALPRGFPLPVAVCQHIAPGMTQMWADALSTKCKVSVIEAKPRSRFEPGTVHIAPTGLQMRLMKGPLGNQVRLDPDFADSLHVPSIDVLFSSAAAQYGSRVLGVLLTGLGCDGAGGMLQIRQAGGYTIGESEQTAASYSMPGAAFNMGGVVEQLPLPKIAERVVELGSKRERARATSSVR